MNAEQIELNQTGVCNIISHLLGTGLQTGQTIHWNVTLPKPGQEPEDVQSEWTIELVTDANRLHFVHHDADGNEDIGDPEDEDGLSLETELNMIADHVMGCYCAANGSLPLESLSEYLHHYHAEPWIEAAQNFAKQVALAYTHSLFNYGNRD